MSITVTRASLIAAGIVKPDPLIAAKRAKGRAIVRRLEAIMARRASKGMK